MDESVEIAYLTTVRNLHSLVKSPFLVLRQFITTYLENCGGRDLLLPRLSEMYLLVVKKPEIRRVTFEERGHGIWHRELRENKHAIKYRDFLEIKRYVPEHCLKDLEQNSSIIAGFMIIKEVIRPNKNVHFIDFIDTTIRGCNFARKMIELYNTKQCFNNKMFCGLLPYEITPKSKNYWIKYFKRECLDYCFYMEEELSNKQVVESFLEGFGININFSRDVKWREIFKP